jgi:Na+-driven multidrug efflux pump
MRIYFAGMPANLLYTFGSAILRAVGDTKRPLYFLTVSGLVNVVLNLVFVMVFQMSVAGVALATVIAQGISASITRRCACTGIP